MINPEARAKYLKKIEEVIERTDKTEHLPATAPVVAMFLEGFMPGDPESEEQMNMTSYEIVQYLKDICVLTTTDVAMTMVYLGYRLQINYSPSPGWVMT